jgi:hypothetical protein
MSTETGNINSADSGLLGLVMLLRFHGLGADPEQIRYRFGAAASALVTKSLHSTATMAATNKCLARNSKSRTEQSTKKRETGRHRRTNSGGYGGGCSEPDEDVDHRHLGADFGSYEQMFGAE